MPSYSSSFNGKGWKFTPAAPLFSSESSNLQMVPYPAATVCLALGNTTNNAGQPSAVAEQLGPKGWTLEATPSTSGKLFSNLLGVSGASSKDSVAVSYHQVSPRTYVTLTDGWNGKARALQTSPAATGTASAQPFDVSYSSATSCALFKPALRPRNVAS
jgi:hypothetical protein